ncbi:MAG: gamma-glutamylcyclotransferase [Gammaproteobacteria bacterium]|nr:gamma-glutamylcyclotransferase [Gammaproteobacteria bacterium]
MKYFAYGSNMPLARLRQRVPNARILLSGMLAQHDLRFHKRSHDGSAKCDAFFTGQDSDRIWGILFEIDSKELPGLRKAEGLGRGYEEKTVDIFDRDGRQHSAMTYYADQDYITQQLKPYDWYKNHVLTGAHQGLLPDDYIARISVVACISDPDKTRANLEFSVHLPVS